MKQFLKSLIAPIVVSLFVVSAAQGYVWQWSKTASTNSTADPSINWAEGMSPSSVNDSARAMMAVTAAWRDDISGLLASTGTSSAYALATNSSIGSPPNDGQMLAFSPHTTNSASATLAVDSGTAYPIQTAPGVAIGTGVIVEGSPYRVKFSTSSSAWLLEGVYNLPSGVPLGAAIPYTGSTAPSSNYVLAYGQCISRSTYASYFAIVSTTYGACDGTTTFGVPDVRGRVVAGKDDMGGTSANRLTNQTGGLNGDTLGATGGAETHTLVVGEIPNHNHSVSGTVSIPNGTQVMRTNGQWQFGGESALGTFQGATANTQVNLFATFTPSETSIGGDDPHNNVQPTIIFTYLIRIM